MAFSTAGKAKHAWKSGKSKKPHHSSVSVQFPRGKNLDFRPIPTFPHFHAPIIIGAGWKCVEISRGKTNVMKMGFAIASINSENGQGGEFDVLSPTLRNYLMGKWSLCWGCKGYTLRV